MNYSFNYGKFVKISKCHLKTRFGQRLMIEDPKILEEEYQAR